MELLPQLRFIISIGTYILVLYMYTLFSTPKLHNLMNMLLSAVRYLEIFYTEISSINKKKKEN